jgi:hypothetical protein
MAGSREVLTKEERQLIEQCSQQSNVLVGRYMKKLSAPIDSRVSGNYSAFIQILSGLMACASVTALPYGISELLNPIYPIARAAGIKVEDLKHEFLQIWLPFISPVLVGMVNYSIQFLQQTEQALEAKPSSSANIMTGLKRQKEPRSRSGSLLEVSQQQAGKPVENSVTDDTLYTPQLSLKQCQENARLKSIQFQLKSIALELKESEPDLYQQFMMAAMPNTSQLKGRKNTLETQFQLLLSVENTTVEQRLQKLQRLDSLEQKWLAEAFSASKAQKSASTAEAPASSIKRPGGPV